MLHSGCLKGRVLVVWSGNWIKIISVRKRKTTKEQLNKYTCNNVKNIPQPFCCHPVRKSSVYFQNTIQIYYLTTLKVWHISVCVGGASGCCRLEKLLSTNPRRQERAHGPLMIDRFSLLNAELRAEAWAGSASHNCVNAAGKFSSF